jgi:hypothetical protein
MTTTRDLCNTVPSEWEDKLQIRRDKTPNFKNPFRIQWHNLAENRTNQEIEFPGKDGFWKLDSLLKLYGVPEPQKEAADCEGNLEWFNRTFGFDRKIYGIERQKPCKRESYWIQTPKVRYWTCKKDGTLKEVTKNDRIPMGKGWKQTDKSRENKRLNVGQDEHILLVADKSDANPEGIPRNFACTTTGWSKRAVNRHDKIQPLPRGVYPNEYSDGEKRCLKDGGGGTGSPVPPKTKSPVPARTESPAPARTRSLVPPRTEPAPTRTPAPTPAGSGTGSPSPSPAPVPTPDDDDDGWWWWIVAIAVIVVALSIAVGAMFLL